jgi:glycosyltransferase involved in cell wall biosynthesis
VVPNGVDVDTQKPLPPRRRADLLRQLGLPDVPTAVCVGRLAKQKGQDVLLDAWDQVVRAVPEARLILVGDGPDHDVLSERTRDVESVTLVGERDDVPNWLAIASVVVAPSRWEGMALAPLEAMACGRSVVMTDVTGAAEIVPEGAGAILPVEDVDALSGALIVRLGDRSLVEREGRLGREHVEKHHSRTAAAASIAQVYADVLGGSQPGVHSDCRQPGRRV